MPKVSPRKLLDYDQPTGYQESLTDWINHNEDAVEWFLENAKTISRMRDALECLATAEMGVVGYAKQYEAEVKEMACTALLAD